MLSIDIFITDLPTTW